MVANSPTGAPQDAALENAGLRWLHRIEDGLLALLLGALVLLAPLQLLLRNLFDFGLGWVDPLLRVLVLWLGLLGALAATRGDRHINVDAIARWLPLRAAAGVALLTRAFATGVSGLVAWHAGRFVADERAFESIAFSGIPSWWLEVVIPVSFGLIAVRYAILTFAALRDLVRGTP